MTFLVFVLTCWHEYQGCLLQSLDLFLSHDVLHPRPVPNVVPCIVYKDVEINKRNVKQYRDALPGAVVDSGSDEIVLFNYRVSRKLKLKPRDELIQAIQRINNGRDAAIAHETKHIQNDGMFMDVWSLRSFYDRAMIFFMDEVSAATAEKIKPDTMHIDDMHTALSYGLDYMLDYYPKYMPEHMENTFFDFRYDTNSRALMRQNPVVYSQNAREIVDNFLTYNGVRLLENPYVIPPEIMDKWRELTNVYEDETRQTLKQRVEKFMDGIYKKHK